MTYLIKRELISILQHFKGAFKRLLIIVIISTITTIVIKNI